MDMEALLLAVKELGRASVGAVPMSEVKQFPWWGRIWCQLFCGGHDIEWVETTPIMVIMRCRRCKGRVWMHYP